MIGDAQQYEQLTQLYREFGDQELLALGRDMSDLTDTAQEVLRAEIALRGLKLVPETEPAHDAASSEPDANDDLLEFAAVAPEECVWEFADIEDATAAGHSLSAEGIRNQVIPQGRGRLDTRGNLVVVKPDDAERAALVLARPAPKELRSKEDLEAFHFNSPDCPGCGAAEPLLESVDPTNQWRCEVCDRVWLEDDPLS